MTMKQRKSNLDQFRLDDDCAVFLLSVRAAACGLTLTAASHIFILEPTINPAVTAQAIGRVHRLGNTHRQVVVHHMIVEGSVEENIRFINETSKDKNKPVGPTLSLDDNDDDGQAAEAATAFRLSELSKLFYDKDQLTRARGSAEYMAATTTTSTNTASTTTLTSGEAVAVVEERSESGDDDIPLERRSRGVGLLWRRRQSMTGHHRKMMSSPASTTSSSAS